MKKQFYFTSVPFSLVLITLFMLTGIDVAIAAESSPAANQGDMAFHVWIIIGFSLAALGWIIKSKP